MSKRRRRGRIPRGSKHLCTTADGEWHVYRKSVSEDGWHALKLLSTNRRAGRANFHLAWSRRCRRFARNIDWKALRDRHPSLHAEVIERVPALLDALYEPTLPELTHEQAVEFWRRYHASRRQSSMEQT